MNFGTVELILEKKKIFREHATTMDKKKKKKKTQPIQLRYNKITKAKGYFRAPTGSQSFHSNY